MFSGWLSNFKGPLLPNKRHWKVVNSACSVIQSPSGLALGFVFQESKSVATGDKGLLSVSHKSFLVPYPHLKLGI